MYIRLAIVEEKFIVKKFFQVEVELGSNKRQCFAEHSVLSFLLSLTHMLFTFNVAQVLYLKYLHRIAMMLVM